MMLLLFVLPVASTSGSPLRFATVTYSAVVPDFSVTAFPPSVTVNAGTPGTSTISVAAINGFTGTIALVQDGGAACSMSAESVTLTATATSGSVTLTCTFAGSIFNYVTVTGTGGSLSHSAIVLLSLVDFAMDTNVGNVVVNAGSSATSTIIFSSLNGFTGVVSLYQNGGAACSLGAATVILGATTPSGSASLTCIYTANGENIVTVTGTSALSSHSAFVTFQVVDFTIETSPTRVTVNSGSPGASTVNVTAVNSFEGTVELSQNGGSACSLSAASVSLTSSITSGSVTLTCRYTAAGNNSVKVTGASGSLSHSATLTVTVTLFVPPKAPEEPLAILGLRPFMFYGAVGVLAVIVITGLVALRRRRAGPSATQPASNPASPAR